MRSFSLKRGLLAAIALQSLVISVVPASAQDLVMRRALPRSITGAVTDPNPPTTNPSDPVEVVTPIVNPTEVCDNKPGSPTPILQYAAWVRSPDVEVGPSTEYPGCKERVRDYHCEASYICTANGENVASGGVVADQVCLDHAYPPIETPM